MAAHKINTNMSQPPSCDATMGNKQKIIKKPRRFLKPARFGWRAL